MFRTTFRAALVTALLTGLGANPGRTGEPERDFVCKVKPAAMISEKVSTNLAPSLLATQEMGGKLKGNDERGNPIIAVPVKNEEKLKKAFALSSWSPQVPANYSTVQKLRISYDPDKKPTEADLKALGLRLVEDYPPGKFMTVAPVDEKRGIDADLATKLENSPKVKHAAPSFKIQAVPTPKGKALQKVSQASKPPTSDPLFGQLWGLQNIRAPHAWKVIKKSPLVVAVIDTGVDYTHEDLEKNIWTSATGKHGYNFVDGNDDPMDKNNHGTHCAGTIGAEGDNNKGVVGVNQGVQIMAVRWLDANGSGHIEDAIKGIDFAVDNGAKVLSNSWFWPQDVPELKSAIKRARDKGALFVAAAANWAELDDNNKGDNDQLDTFGRFPSCYDFDNVLAVVAIDDQEKKAGFSNWGKLTTHLAAPGVDILSTVRDNKNGNSDDDYDFFSGTSMATPHVAGAAALVWAHPAYTGSSYKDIRGLLLKHARPINGLKDRCTTGATLDISFLGPTVAGIPKTSKDRPEKQKQR